MFSKKKCEISKEISNDVCSGVGGGADNKTRCYIKTQDYLDPKLLFEGGQADRHRI